MSADHRLVERERVFHGLSPNSSGLIFRHDRVGEHRFDGFRARVANGSEQLANVIFVTLGHVAPDHLDARRKVAQGDFEAPKKVERLAASRVVAVEKLERVIENGTLVLNADDKESAALAHRESVLKTKKQIVFFAMSEENPIVQKHLDSGETAYFARGSRILEKRAGRETVIAEISLIPLTMNGTADFQIQNAMVVCAVSRALGLSSAEIAAGLYGFQNQLHNPGRSNFYRVGKGYALIDYGHNPKAMEAICRMTARWAGKTVTGIISFPGDRRDDVIEAAGRIAVAGFDRIIVKGDTNLRGRASGEVAEMLCRIVLEKGNQRECKIVLDAALAFDDAIANIEENEVVVFFYEKLAPVLATLEKYGATAADTF